MTAIAAPSSRLWCRSALIAGRARLERLVGWKADLQSKMAEEKEEAKMMRELATEGNWRQDYDKELNSQSHLYR